MGIPCSLLIFISLATSKRGLYGHDIFGDESLSCVVKSNMHLSRACLLAMVCMARNVFWAAEQPSTSKLPQIPYYWELLSDPLLQTYFTRLSGPQNLSGMTSRYQLIRKKNCLTCPKYNPVRRPSWMGAWQHVSCKPSMLLGTWYKPQPRNWLNSNCLLEGNFIFTIPPVYYIYRASMHMHIFIDVLFVKPNTFLYIQCCVLNTVYL